MKLKLIFSLLFVSSVVFAQNKEGIIDGIAAQVGDNIILISDLEAQKLQLIQAGEKLDKSSDCKILEMIMFQHLLVNQAKLDSLEISDQQVDAEMENRLRVIEGQIGSRQKMEEFYGKTYGQIKDEFRETIRERMLAQEMERQITADVSVTPKEVKQYYNGLPADSIPFISSKLMFQQIVQYPEVTSDNKKEAYEKLKDIREQILGGKSFATMARLYSQDPGSAANGGKLGEVRRGMMVAPFEAAVFSLEKDQVSDIFETEYGYHIVKLLNRKGDVYEAAHILISPTFDDASLEKAALKIDSCYNSLKKGEITWDDAVLKYSNDEATNQNRGIITNPFTGDQQWEMEHLSQIDQQIYLITDNLEEGQYSEPGLYFNIIERKEGVRIVRLKQRTSPHKANLSDDYELVKNAALNDKKQRIVEEWINAKIKNAYIRLDDAYKHCEFEYDWK